MKNFGAFQSGHTSRQHGFTVLEFLFSMAILTIGVGGVLPLLLGSMTIDKKAAGDTTSIMVADLVLVQISSQGAQSQPALFISECATSANIWTVNVQRKQPSGNFGANLTAAGTIDWSQDYNAIPAGYAMRYVACSTTNDVPVTYEVRWTVIQTSSADTTKMIVMSARPKIASPIALGFIAPVNLRTIIGL